MTVREEQRFKLMIEEPDAVRCRKCSGAMIYTKREIYQCERCGATYLSNFGRVKECLKENGPMNLVQLSEATSLERRIISGFVREGRLQLAGGSHGNVTLAK